MTCANRDGGTRCGTTLLALNRGPASSARIVLPILTAWATADGACLIGRWSNCYNRGRRVGVSGVVLAWSLAGSARSCVGWRPRADPRTQARAWGSLVLVALVLLLGLVALSGLLGSRW